MKVAILTFYVDGGDIVFLCENDTAIILNLYKVFEERLNEKWYTDDDDDQEIALSIVEAKKNGQFSWVADVRNFMESRCSGEYEDFTIDVKEIKTYSDELVDYIPKRYRHFD